MSDIVEGQLLANGSEELGRVKTMWMSMPRILSREGAMPRVSGFFFKAVIQALLLFGAEETYDGTSPTEDNGRDVEIHLGVGCKGGGGFLDDG